MAESQTPPQTVQTDSTTVSVRARLIWASRPMGFLFLAFWALHPSSTLHADYIHLPLLGFLAGICYGIVVFHDKLRDYIGLKQDSYRFAVNRLPDEYYIGIVEKILFIRKK